MDKIPNIAVVRQFARAVLADRLTGDELTRLALTKAEVDPEADADDLGDLMRAFMRAWRAAADGRAPAPPLFSDRALRNALPSPPDEDRLMLLFVDVLGFSLDEAERILAPMQKPAEQALADGRKIVDKKQRAAAIVIEDEPLIAAELRDLLEKMGVEVRGSASNAAQALALADRARPDLILADYSLEDGETGAEVVGKILRTHDCPIIFITGFPDKVLQGEDVEPDFVISKPYRLETIRAAVAHCIEARSEGEVGP
jgi:CheY-like chemotaxis protein